MLDKRYGVISIGLVRWLLLSATTALFLGLFLALSFSLKQTYREPRLQADHPQTDLPQTGLPQAALPQSAEYLLKSLPDGAYQFCTEPVPTDWRDGAGACLNIIKQGLMLDGYYGYPHSERFVCLNGEVLGDWLYGSGFVISWSGHPWSEVPQEAFLWDQEGRLTLSEGAVTRAEEDVSWITFQQADLDMTGLQLYPSPRMNPPAQLCN